MERSEVIFEVLGKPVGYYTSGKYPNWGRMKAYQGYKQLVQGTAVALAHLKLPLIATKERPLMISTTTYFPRKGAHPDPENIHKGIVDALFYTPKGGGKGPGDKYVGGLFWPPLYSDRPRVVVTVREIGVPEGWGETLLDILRVVSSLEAG